jgi:hypothetical protein
LHPLEAQELPNDVVQVLFQAIAPIEAQEDLRQIEVVCFPKMKREGQNKTLSRLKKVARSFQVYDGPRVTTKELFEQLRSK